MKSEVFFYRLLNDEEKGKQTEVVVLRLSFLDF